MATVYDPDKQASSDSSEPRTIHKNPAKPSENSEGSERGNLQQAESNANTGTSGGFNFNPKGDDGSTGTAGSLLTKERAATSGGLASGFQKTSKTAPTASGRIKKFFWGSTNRRRATVGGGIFGSMLLGGGVFAFIVISGPAQLIQLDQMLQRNFTGTDQASSSRLGQLISSRLPGSPGARDLGETRLSFLGKQYFRGYQAALIEKGIEFKPNSLAGFGGRDAATFDTNKLEHGSKELQGASREQRAAWLKETFSIPADSLRYKGGGIFSVDATAWSTGQIETFLKSTIGILGNGRIFNAIANRQFSKYFDLPSMWRPFSRAVSSKIRGLLNRSDSRQAQQEEQQAEEKIQTDKVGAPAEDAVAGLRDQASSLNDFTTQALLYTGGSCFLRNTAGEIIKINRYRVVLPTAVMALRFIAIGEQIKSGQDITAEQMGAAEHSLYDSKGQGVWQGRALQVTSGDKNASGPDIPVNIQQAYSADTTANSIESVADKALGGATLASALCSQAGIIAQGLVSVFQIVGSAALEVFSDGTATPLVGESLLTKLGAAGAKIGVSGLEMYAQIKALGFAEHFVLDKAATGSLPKNAFSGPLGGNLLAYGAREAANMGAIASGGIALDSSDSKTYADVQQQQDEKQFRSESFFARAFKADDSRSLAGHLVQSVSPSSSQNVASMVTGFGNIGGGLLSNLASIFSPKTHAAANYNWTFPQYGIPQKMLKDPDLADPYVNADNVGKTLDAECLNDDGSVDKDCHYISNANKCFGADIDKDGDGVWDVTTVGNYQDNDIDPNNNDYIDANCSDLGDINWKRLVMFIFDMRTAQASACFSGDDQSCKDVGYDQTDAAAGGSTGPGDGSLPSGNTQQLAQQIVQLHNQGKITYALDTTALDNNFKRMANGEKPQTDNGHQPTPDPRILQAIIYLAEQGTVQLNSYTDGESHTSPGNPHYEGKAIDIGAFKGHTLGSGDVATTKEAEEIMSHVLPEHSRFGADFYTDYSWTAPITLSGKTFYTGNDSGGHLHTDTLNVN